MRLTGRNRQRVAGMRFKSVNRRAKAGLLGIIDENNNLPL
ncbi:hypothetical protein CEV34_2974 [Brucella pseudogrignonensis]|uniref:Uncharacterized protein n=1 Tax=Brucella pseudogrignonensis TaxID=419475 RepID=A0A256GEP2_9HYPH|nr:hypothetical protein CEV34_2974 [Brucella pseudogrignonensis]